MTEEIAKAIDEVCASIAPEELRRAITNLLYNALRSQSRDNDIVSVIELMQVEDFDA